MWGWFEPRSYRCEQCGVTSPEVYTRRELDDLRHGHRMEAHGGFIPDGEAVLQPERMRLADLPREQRIMAGVLLALIVLSLIVKAS